MPYTGKVVMSRDVAHEARKGDRDWGWINYELTKAVAVANAESHCYLGAFHDNIVAPLSAALEDAAEDGEDTPLKAGLYARYGPPSVEGEGLSSMWETGEGTVLSRDCGIYEFNIPAREIGTEVEFALRTESRDPAEYMPVFRTSVERAWDYYNARWTRDGKPDIRRWQAWAAYTSGWATFPCSWVWHHDENGKGVGPWVKTGRYIFNAIAGQMNNMIVNEKLWEPVIAQSFGKKYALHFGITADQGTLVIAQDSLKNMIVRWQFPPAPTTAPPDGAGPYPIRNNGV